MTIVNMVGSGSDITDDISTGWSYPYEGKAAIVWFPNKSFSNSGSAIASGEKIKSLSMRYKASSNLSYVTTSMNNDLCDSYMMFACRTGEYIWFNKVTGLITNVSQLMRFNLNISSIPRSLDDAGQMMTPALRDNLYVSGRYKFKGYPIIYGSSSNAVLTSIPTTQALYVKPDENLPVLNGEFTFDSASNVFNITSISFEDGASSHYVSGTSKTEKIYSFLGILFQTITYVGKI